ncbi:RNA-binding protein Rsf1 [Trichinella pseudospiralis]|uniref:RNA-binding protein Rsf1 n=1 Tax=Trichinella pseudospiralis TaxID=6337 RepID=A0A0V1IL24_TRIPS|nr:RNA-binding protein Rsf1 [Trichinella pseudospiralis]
MLLDFEYFFYTFNKLRRNTHGMNFSEGEESSSNKLYQGDNHNAVKEATIFVGNLNGCIMRVDLANHFQKFGKIVSIVLPMNRPFYAFIQFSKAEEAKAALKHGLRQNVRGCNLRVDKIRPRY